MKSNNKKILAIVLILIVLLLLIWFFVIRKTKKKSFNKSDYTYLVDYLSKNIGYHLRKVNLAYIGTQITLSDRIEKNGLINRIRENDKNIEYDLTKGYNYEILEIPAGGTDNVYGNITTDKIYYNVKPKDNPGIYIMNEKGKLVDKNKNVLNADLVVSEDDKIYMIIEFRDDKSKTLIFNMKIPMDKLTLEDESSGVLYEGSITGIIGTQTIYWDI